MRPLFLFRRGRSGLLVVAVVITLTGCGSDSGESSSPTSPSPSGPRDGAPGLTLSGISVSRPSVLSQQGAQGSVSMTGAAPSGGAIVTLSSSNPSAARVPSTVTVPAGAAEATFGIDAATVATTTAVTLTASYNSVTRNTSFTVRPPAVSAAFTVSSLTRGTGACVLGPSTGDADCVLDGTSSTGPVERWTWSYWTAGAPIGHVATQPRSTMNLSTRCAFFEGARGGDGPNGDRYIQMEVELTVQDREGNRSAAVRLPVKMYPNRLCGFNY